MSSAAATLLLRRAAATTSLGSKTAAARAVAKRTLAAAADGSLRKTALNDLHKELGGDMVPFAGYELPVLYKGENGGVMKEHLWCRADGKASLFDVSHMGQVSLPFQHHCSAHILN
jgi:aminomethyltransferase